MEKQVLVQFTAGFRGYNAGERATFSPGRAAELIAAGVAAEPGVLSKLAEKAKEIADRKVSRGAPEIGKKVSFFVDGLGDVFGVITDLPKTGAVKVQVGEGDDVDEYEVERTELVVLE
jgi:hypothetical protein